MGRPFAADLHGPLVVCSVMATEVEAAARALAGAHPQCALVELRADRLRAGEIETLVRGSTRELIVTVRRREQGGAFDGSEEERRRALLAALDAGARFVDVEWYGALADLARGELSSRVILSHHGPMNSLTDLKQIRRAMSEWPAARLKLVPQVNRLEDNLVLRDLLGSQPAKERRLACFATGRAGALSRLLAPLWGSWATYGSARRDAPTGPGQFTAFELLEIFDVLGLDEADPLFLLLGSRVFASPSPAMHRAGYREAGIRGAYLPVEADRFEDLPALIDRPKGLTVAGLAVTRPFKHAAAARCSVVDPLSRRSGAVNTVVIRGKRWHGTNTDGPAALECIARWLEPGGVRVALLGAGGTAAAIGSTLVQAGARVVLFNRTPEHARQTAERVGARWRPLDELPAFAWDVLINATPLGGKGESELPVEELSGRLVLDAVYAPGGTPLIRDAAERGLATVDGVELLVAQGLRQFRRMTGCAASATGFERAAREWLGRGDGASTGRGDGIA